MVTPGRFSPIHSRWALSKPPFTFPPSRISRASMAVTPPPAELYRHGRCQGPRPSGPPGVGHPATEAAEWRGGRRTRWRPKRRRRGAPRPGSGEPGLPDELHAELYLARAGGRARDAARVLQV